MNTKIKHTKLKNEKGQALIISVILFLFVSLIIVFGIVSPALREIKITKDILSSRGSFLVAEAGVEDAVYRIKNAMAISNTEILNINGAIATTTISDIGANEKEIITNGDYDKRIRNVKVKLVLTSDEATFNFGVQSDEGGLHMKNTSTVNGNIYSNGPVTGANNNFANGDVVSAGPTGLIDNVNVAQDAYAHTIKNSDIGGDAYYTVISNTTVSGTKYPGSPDQPTSTLPISDTLIESWKSQAAAGGVISSPCPYIINSNTTLGPVKIDCDLEIKDSPNVTISGFIWVNGNIDIQNSPTIKLDSSLGSNSSGFIADNESDRINSSKIILRNSTQFQNSGSEGSYILAISQNNSSENGGDIEAIEAKNAISGDVLVYAPHGEVEVQNSVNLRQVTGYKIEIKNSAQINYEVGLSSLLFSSGPSGGWEIVNWEEI